MGRRVSRARAFILATFLGFLGVLVLLFAAARPSIGRFVAGAVLLGAASFVRSRGRRRDSLAGFGRADEIRSLLWSVALIAAFVGVSLLFAHPWTD